MSRLVVVDVGRQARQAAAMLAAFVAGGCRANADGDVDGRLAAMGGGWRAGWQCWRCNAMARAGGVDNDLLLLLLVVAGWRDRQGGDDGVQCRQASQSARQWAAMLKQYLMGKRVTKRGWHLLWAADDGK